MKKVAVVTTTRAEYGILRPLLFKLKEEQEIDLQLVVTGMHLVDKYGNTQNEIIKDGIEIYKSIPVLEKGNRPYDISITMSNAIAHFARYFQDEKPDVLVILGDRTEILGICCAAMNERIPIAHLHGGELTEGAVDDCIRHAVTKMSYLHFAATEVYRKRIIQMGEAPERVFNVGALGVENIVKLPLLSYEDMCIQTGIPINCRYVIATFHPVTLEGGQEHEQTEQVIQALKKKKEYFYLVTKANADAGGDTVNEMLERFAKECKNVKLVSSLGAVKYLSAVKYCEFVLGNSSSGIIEAPALGIPTINIGNRQEGRMMADTIISCQAREQEILSAMDMVEKMEHKVSELYGTGNTSDKIVEKLKSFLLDNSKGLNKRFYDI